MSAPPLRLQMTVSEPWDFGSGPVEMSVVDAADETHWSVDIQEGWPMAVDAILSCRYEGQTFVGLQFGEQVAANLSAKVGGQSRGLIGTVRLIG
jgi:hypothetical protein